MRKHEYRTILVGLGEDVNLVESLKFLYDATKAKGGIYEVYWTRIEKESLITQARQGIKRDSVVVPGKSPNAIKLMYTALRKQGILEVSGWTEEDKQTVRRLVLGEGLSPKEISQGNFLKVPRSADSVRMYVHRSGLRDLALAQKKDVAQKDFVADRQRTEDEQWKQRVRFLTKAREFSRLLHAPPIQTCASCNGAWYRHEYFYEQWTRHLRSGKHCVVFKTQCRLCTNAW